MDIDYQGIKYWFFVGNRGLSPIICPLKDYSTTNGIFNAGHAVQDSYAGGHRNFAEYHGMVRSVIMRPDHFLRDANISMSTYRGIVGVTRNMIDQYNRNAPSMMLNLRVRLH